MDDACAEVVLSFESRPRAQWEVSDRLCAGIDGFVDAWYDKEGSVEGWSMGTNLRQFVDGFALGSGATVLVTVQSAVNLHHLYEAVFRALGETVAAALGLSACVPCLPGDSSGLAGAPHYSIETIDKVGS
jgi:imidazoleglycerol phosphate dehydratase HisB